MILGGAKFYCQLVYSYNPLRQLKEKDIRKFVFEKRPTLKYRNDVIIVIN